ncbi:MAG: endonuclease III [Planctomycetes bacterium]|nr:endonuclease III [Planctomycetota bacterium]
MPPSTAARRRPSPQLRQRAERIAAQLACDYADATCALRHASPLELLLATILSAQCTDDRVNRVTPALFARFPTAAALAAAPPGAIETLIRSCGFFNAKARNLRGCCRALVERHGGEVPRTMDELVRLPGVARKTANVVLGTAFGIAVGVVVDTHVQRITRLLGLTRQRTPERIEQDLMALLPPDAWIDFSHRLIWHGRRVCSARRPRCDDCSLAALCPSARQPAARPAAQSAGRAVGRSRKSAR